MKRTLTDSEVHAIVHALDNDAVAKRSAAVDLERSSTPNARVQQALHDAAEVIEVLAAELADADEIEVYCEVSCDDE